MPVIPLDISLHKNRAALATSSDVIFLFKGALSAWIFFMSKNQEYLNGIEKIVEIELDNVEKNNFDVSIKAVKELFDAAKKIDKDLEK